MLRPCVAQFGSVGLLVKGGLAVRRLPDDLVSFVDDDVLARFERELGADLRSGRWDARHGALRTLPEFDGSLRLVIGRGRPSA